jgi:hypothetical protein
MLPARCAPVGRAGVYGLVPAGPSFAAASPSFAAASRKMPLGLTQRTGVGLVTVDIAVRDEEPVTDCRVRSVRGSSVTTAP